MIHQTRLTALLLFVTTVSAVVLNEYQFCVKYFGNVEAELELAESVPEYNYNGTIICPRSHDLPTVSGATLEICPSDDYQNEGSILTANLRLSASGILDLPIDGLNLRVELITNGSVSGPFDNNGQPAVLAKDSARSQPFQPVWTINGTQESLNEYPSPNASTLGVFFGCQGIRNPSIYRYCGFYQDTHGNGCWSSQQFDWNMQSPLNYTIRFSPSEASVELHAASKYGYRDDDGNPVFTGSYTRAFLRFGGVPHVPSVVDYDFWENAEQVYEVEVDNHHDVKLQEDQNGMPVFVNGTDAQDWYAAANGTFSQEVEGSGMRTSLVFGLVASAILTSVGLIML